MRLTMKVTFAAALLGVATLLARSAVADQAAAAATAADENASDKQTAEHPPAGEKPKKVQQREQLTFEQSKVAAEMTELEERMFRLSEALKSMEPENSSRLMLGLRYAREELILHQMKEIQEVLDKLALDDAVTSQKQLMSKLQRLQELLLSKDLDFQMRLARLRQLRQVLRKLDTVIAEEDREKRASELIAKKENQLKSLERKLAGLQALIKRQTEHIASDQKLAEVRDTKPLTELAALTKAQTETRKDTQKLASDKEPAEADNKPDPAEETPEKPAKEADKPAEKSADKPGEKPAEKPTEKIAKKSDDKPADKPDEKRDEKNLTRAATEMSSAVKLLDDQNAKQALAPMQEALAALEAERDAAAQMKEALKKELAREKFKRLEREQAKNRGENEDVTNMARLLGDSGASAMGELLRASNSMASASSALGQMQAGGAAGDQEAALKSLKYARAKLADEAKRLLDDLLQQMKRTVMDGLAGMLEQQIEVRQGTEVVAPRLKEGSRLAQTTVKALANREGKLVDTASELVGMVEETGFGIALPAALTVIRDAMQDVQGSLEQGDASPAVVTAEKNIESELKSLIEAMKQLPGGPRRGDGNNNNGNGQNERERELNRIVAELRIIKMLQLHVNRGTTDADKQRLALNKLAPELRKRIEDLRFRQEDIRDVTDRLAEERGEEVSR